MLEKERIKSIIESLLFINEKPLGLEELKQVIEVDKKEIEKYIEELSQEYQKRSAGICIVKVAGGYQMCSLPDNEPWVKKMYKEKYKYKLSSAAL
jgi:segregation and condensation protein B